MLWHSSRPKGQKGLALKGTRQVEFLSQVVDETLRVITFPLTVSREANTDVEMNCYLIPKGWKVLTWFRNVHMDPEVYLDPRKFDPSRWDKGFIPKAGAFLLVLEAIYAKKYDLPGFYAGVGAQEGSSLKQWPGSAALFLRYSGSWFGVVIVLLFLTMKLSVGSFLDFSVCGEHSHHSGETEQHQVSTDVLACLIPDRLIIARK
ncbi:hypothetical protein YC2023_019286 [Brassica napus]